MAAAILATAAWALRRNLDLAGPGALPAIGAVAFDLMVLAEHGVPR